MFKLLELNIFKARDLHCLFGGGGGTVMSKRWTTFRGTSRDHLFNTGTMEKNLEDRWPAMLDPSTQSWRTNLVSIGSAA